MHIISNRVIAISGWKRSGKDTLASHLVSQYGYEQLSFAASLKDSVAKQYNLARAMLDDQKLKEEPLLHLPAIPSDAFTEAVHNIMQDSLRSGYWTPRALCILEGSVKRSVYSNYWVSKVAEKIKENPDKKYVISDLRYKSEADTLRMLIPKEELLVARVHRFQEIDTNDPSERDLDDYSFDVQLANLGSIEDYVKNIDFFLEHIKIFKR